MGRGAEAEKLLAETREHQLHVYGPDNPTTGRSTYVLGAWAALSGGRDKAFALLREAVDHGLDDATRKGIEADRDLKSLRGDPRFSELLAVAHKQP